MNSCPNPIDGPADPGLNAPAADPEAVMRLAASLALRGRGAAAPNPCVGAVLVKDGAVVAQGWHRRYGGPHAEVEALADARYKGIDPADCVLFVTLEPCNHHGKTPPCTKAVLDAGIRRVVIGTLDPNPDVAGGGAAFLRERGVEVQVGVAEELCRELIADFLHWKATDRPFVLLKLAATLDGKIATRTGHSQWVTGPEARAEVHALRAMVQAVLVGGETFRLDNPRLDARLASGEPDPEAAQPLAVVLTSKLPAAGEDFFLLRRRATETLFWTSEEAAAGQEAQDLRDLGCGVLGLSAQGGGLDIAVGLAALRRDHGCRYVLCEGGGRLALSLLDAGLVNEFHLHLAPKIMGDDKAKSLFAGRSIVSMDECLGFSLRDMRRAGEDLLLTLKPKHHPGPGAAGL